MVESAYFIGIVWGVVVTAILFIILWRADRLEDAREIERLTQQSVWLTEDLVTYENLVKAFTSGEFDAAEFTKKWLYYQHNDEVFEY